MKSVFTDKQSVPRDSDLRESLSAAKVYAEGRGIRIEVKDETVINDIKELINVKLAN
jgi:hypothetical protein